MIVIFGQVDDLNTVLFANNTKMRCECVWFKFHVREKIPSEKHRETSKMKSHLIEEFRYPTFYRYTHLWIAANKTRTCKRKQPWNKMDCWARDIRFISMWCILFYISFWGVMHVLVLFTATHKFVYFSQTRTHTWRCAHLRKGYREQRGRCAEYEINARAIRLGTWSSTYCFFHDPTAEKKQQHTTRKRRKVREKWWNREEVKVNERSR